MAQVETLQDYYAERKEISKVFSTLKNTWPAESWNSIKDLTEQNFIDMGLSEAASAQCIQLNTEIREAIAEIIDILEII